MKQDTSEPDFLVLEYVTITRDPRTQLVVAIGGDERAAGILQTLGGFVSAPGPRGPYHRQPHTMPVDRQRHRATAAAQALLLAGFSVHFDPALNTLHTPDGDRQAAHRCLDQLAERARDAAADHEVADVLAQIAAPHDGLLPRLVNTLNVIWASWAERLDAAQADADLADQLRNTASGLSAYPSQIERISRQAASTPTPRRPSTAPAALPQAPARRR
ncbi:hypothetical protein ACIQU3_19020 [Streptomyces sp. NPDC101110]|uniref:hypothetical protein n=1 Tax=Streptomyces sp. NPDC101110 TaxID=3366104 RepID=UPI00380155EC